MFYHTKHTNALNLQTLGFLSALLLLVGCGGSGNTTADNNTVANDTVDAGNPACTTDPLIHQVIVWGQRANCFVGTPPEVAASTSLEVLSETEQNIVPGSSRIIALSWEQPATLFYIVTGDNRYYKALLNQPTNTLDLTITFADQLELKSYPVNFHSTAPNSVSNRVQTIDFKPLESEASDLQVSVTWDQESDIDLKLREPEGFLIDFSRRESEAGGVLDVDSNARCSIDGRNAENITYKNGAARDGRYAIFVDYYSNCLLPTPTNYIVTVRDKGEVITFSGTLSESGRKGIHYFTINDNGEFEIVSNPAATPGSSGVPLVSLISNTLVETATGGWACGYAEHDPAVYTFYPKGAIPGLDVDWQVGYELNAGANQPTRYHWFQSDKASITLDKTDTGEAVILSDIKFHSELYFSATHSERGGTVCYRQVAINRAEP